MPLPFILFTISMISPSSFYYLQLDGSTLCLQLYEFLNDQLQGDIVDEESLEMMLKAQACGRRWEFLTQKNMIQHENPNRVSSIRALNQRANNLLHIPYASRVIVPKKLQREILQHQVHSERVSNLVLEKDTLDLPYNVLLESITT